jgi:hypothetical protein
MGSRAFIFLTINNNIFFRKWNEVCSFRNADSFSMKHEPHSCVLSNMISGLIWVNNPGDYQHKSTIRKLLTTQHPPYSSVTVLLCCNPFFSSENWLFCVETVYTVRLKGKHEVCKLGHLYSDRLVSEPTKIVSRTLHTTGLMIFPFHETAVSHLPSYLWRTWINARIVFSVTTIECESDGETGGVSVHCVPYWQHTHPHTHIHTHTHTRG